MHRLICEIVFKSSINLKKHNEHVHGENERQFYCNLCESSLKSHVERIHERIRKLWYCEICNKEYATIRRMKEHFKRVHENFNFATFDCELCDKKYSQKEYLDRHIKSVHEKIPFMAENDGIVMFAAKFSSDYLVYENI